MAHERCQALSTVGLPQSDRGIIAATGKDTAILIEAHCLNPTGVPTQRQETALTARLPESYRLILTATGQQPPIRAEGDGPHPVQMSLEHLNWVWTVTFSPDGRLLKVTVHT